MSIAPTTGGTLFYCPADHHSCSDYLVGNGHLRPEGLLQSKARRKWFASDAGAICRYAKREKVLSSSRVAPT